MKESQRIEMLRKEKLLEHIRNIPIPISLQTALASIPLKDRVIAQAVVRLELSARPRQIRFLETIVATSNGVASFLFGMRMQNFTVGEFQIGVLTSLKWTNSPVTAIRYLSRLKLLVSSDGAVRIFRLGLRKFRRRGGPQDLQAFAEFYNGSFPSMRSTAKVTYAEALRLFLSDQHFGRGLVGITRQLSQEIRQRFNSRMELIQRSLSHPEKIAATLLVCSVSRRCAVYSETFPSSRTDNSLDASRSVGSILKIALYSAYLEKSNCRTDATIIDEPILVQSAVGEIRPRNADNRFRGKVTLEYAFANSINIPAIRIIQILGIEQFSRYLRKCGISAPIPNSPLLALGALKLRPHEALSLLSPIVTGGHLLSCERQLLMPRNNGERIVSPGTVEKMRHLLSQTSVIGTARLLAKHGFSTRGGKTGTSEKSRDLWYVGWVNEDLYGLVWLGNDDESPVETNDGIPASATRFAVPLWLDVLRAIEEGASKPIENKQSDCRADGIEN